MFNKKEDNEPDFCESYKSGVLDNEPKAKETSLFDAIIKSLTILILLAIIIGVSFYGYNYFINSQKVKDICLPPISMQISDDELRVELDESENEESREVVNDSLSLVVTTENQNDAIAKSEVEKENETKVLEPKEEELKKELESLEVPTSAPEAQYLEELADLSKDIDNERKK